MAKGYLARALHLNYGGNVGFRNKPTLPGPQYGDQYLPDPSRRAIPPSPTNPAPVQPEQGQSAPPPSYDGGGNDDGSYESDTRTAAGRAQGLETGRATPGQIAGGLFNVFSPVPGIGDYLGTQVDKATNFGGIPAHERFGASGTLGNTGGVFDSAGRAYDPVTGVGLNEYSNKDAFKSGSYVQGIKHNPYSIDSYLSDPDNAAKYSAANAIQGAGGRGAHGFYAAQAGDRGLYAGQDDTGGGLTSQEAGDLAKYIGQTELGFQEHTVDHGTATNEAIQGKGYSDSGAAGAGSQFSSTGTFSSSHTQHDSNDDNNDSFNDHGVSHSGGDSGVSFADDAASSDSGGGGGK